MNYEKTEKELLKEIIELLKPISMLSDHYNEMINNDVEKKKSFSHLKKTRTASGEMKKEAYKSNT
mgnify:FL=1|tara:strand:+ start:271 stop:465 length:195 start_codon:yes stop_codon:yes gene_type:complete